MCRCSSAFERACADAHPVQTKPRPREPLSLPTQPNQDLANCTERFMCARSLAVFLTREACPPKCKLCLGGARRRNICAPRPILDGRRLGNHPFYRCPLKDSCAHASLAVFLAREACPPKCKLCLGGACRRNICAPRPILDGRRLGNHPFYRCPLKDSSAHAAPECRAHPRRRRPSRPGCPRSQRRRRRGGASDRARRQGCRRGGASGRASLPSTAVATARRRRFRPGTVTTPRLRRRGPPSRVPQAPDRRPRRTVTADAGRAGPQMPAAPDRRRRPPRRRTADAGLAGPQMPAAQVRRRRPRRTADAGRAGPQTPAAPGRRHRPRRTADASCAESRRQHGAAALILRSCWSAH